MTLGQIDTLESTFEQAVPRADFVAAMLYARLFEIDPELSLRFRGNLLERIRKLLSDAGESTQTG